MLETFHGEGDRDAGRDGVERVAVAKLVRLGDRLQIVDAAVAAEAFDRFIFRPAVGVADLIAVVNPDFALAANGAGVTGAPRRQQFLFVGFPFEIVRPLENALAEIARGQKTRRIECADQGRGTLDLQVPGLRMLLDALAQGTAKIGDRLGIVRGVEIPTGAAHGDRLQVLRAHHRAHAAAAIEMPQLVGQRRIADEVLAADADLQDPDPLVAEFVANRVLHLFRLSPPQLASVAQFDLVVMDGNIDRLFRSPAHGDRLVSRHFQFRPPESASLRLAVGAGQGRTSGHGKTSRSGNGRAGEQTVGEDQQVLRRQGIRTRRQLAQQQIAGQRLATGVETIKLLVEGLYGDGFLRQIDAQYPAFGAISHESLPECSQLEGALPNFAAPILRYPPVERVCRSRRSHDL